MTGSVCYLLTLILWFVYIIFSIHLESANDTENIFVTFRKHYRLKCVLLFIYLVRSRCGSGHTRNETRQPTIYLCLRDQHISQHECWFNGCWHEGMNLLDSYVVISWFATVTIFLGVRLRWSHFTDSKSTRVELFYLSGDLAIRVSYFVANELLIFAGIFPKFYWFFVCSLVLRRLFWRNGIFYFNCFFKLRNGHSQHLFFGNDALLIDSNLNKRMFVKNQRDSDYS